MAVWETDFFRATKKMYKRRPIGHTKNMEHLGLIKKSSLSTGLFVMGIITSIVAIVLYFIGLNSATPSLFIPTIIVAAIGAVMYFVSATLQQPLNGIVQSEVRWVVKIAGKRQGFHYRKVHCGTHDEVVVIDAKEVVFRITDHGTFVCPSHRQYPIEDRCSTLIAIDQFTKIDPNVPQIGCRISSVTNL